MTKANDSLRLIKKGLKLLPSDRDVNFIIYVSLILLPLEQGSFPKKSDGKEYPVVFFGRGGGKRVFVLLTEVITLHISLIVV